MAEARRALGKRVQLDGYIPPWHKMFGVAWMPEPVDKPSSSLSKASPWYGLTGAAILIRGHTTSN